MKIRAVIFDVYGTLLQVGPPPSNADKLWIGLFKDTFHKPPLLSRLEFSLACQRAIGLRHHAAHARGIPHPEILWPAIVAEVLPGFAKLDAATRTTFIYRQIQIGRSLRLMTGAGALLRWLHDKGITLGIASNAQAYTRRELETAFQGSGGALTLFQSDLCIWSFEHGFSKPDPHVFQLLRTRLEARGIAAAETIMVGDRLDNDVEPAVRHGLRAWQLQPKPGGPNTGNNAGNLAALQEFLVRSI